MAHFPQWPKHTPSPHITFRSMDFNLAFAFACPWYNLPTDFVYKITECHTFNVFSSYCSLTRTEKMQQVIWGLGLLMFIQFPELKCQYSANAPRVARPHLCPVWTIRPRQPDPVWHVTWGTWSEVGAWPLPPYITWWYTVHHVICTEHPMAMENWQVFLLGVWVRQPHMYGKTEQAKVATVDLNT